MSDADGRQPLVPNDTDPFAWSYLQPLVDAEVRWGNRATGEFREHRDLGWALHFKYPLHMQQIRDTFTFPAGVELVDDEARTSVIDRSREVRVSGNIRPGYRLTARGVEKDDGLLSRVIYRILGQPGKQP